MSKHHLTWLGHGTFLLNLENGKNILIDPWLDGNPSFPEGYELPLIDLILVTHGHFDHIASTPALCTKQKNHAVVVGIFELCHWLERKGVTNTLPMNKGGTVNQFDIDITMVHADHSCGISEDDGSIIYGGEAVGFVLKLDEKKSLYFAGDTNVFSDMKLIAELYSPNIACLPIGNRFTMGPYEAARAIDMLDVELVIPMHFGTFPDLTGTPNELCGHSLPEKVQIIVPEPGKTIEV